MESQRTFCDLKQTSISSWHRKQN